MRFGLTAPHDAPSGARTPHTRDLHGAIMVPITVGFLAGLAGRLRRPGLGRGRLVGPLFGRLDGLYLMLLLPVLDVDLAQNAMFDATPPDWARLMPAAGTVRVLLDGAFTPTFDEAGVLLLALGWVLALGALAAVVFSRIAAPQHA